MHNIINNLIMFTPINFLKFSNWDKGGSSQSLKQVLRHAIIDNLRCKQQWNFLWLGYAFGRDISKELFLKYLKC